MIINYAGAFIVIITGLYMVLTKKNLIKIVLGLSMIDSGTNLLLISFGYRDNATAPIFDTAAQKLDHAPFVDPVPQALTLTSIVIGACVTALALSLVIKVYEHYGTIDADKVRRLNG
ncbi:MAG: NADH-quinone oxidoreductase subunit K [Clostridiales bacterium]|nr:NADH-quinone oxidoreductase subunit K [Clostridiales bacterium]HBM81869.1 cation:proton antiporter [Clostridiaceae bacterium]